MFHNIHDQFLEYLKKEEKSLDQKKDSDLEKHHIIPLHDGGTKYGQTILCTAKNHTLAHYYRFLIYKKRGDFVAFRMRWDQKIGKRDRALLAVTKNKSLKQLFWSSEWQRQQGKKGGLIGGSKNTKAQLAARQKVGLTYGQKNGSSNASENLKIMLSKKIIWVYKCKDQPDKEIAIDPLESASAVIDTLTKYSNKNIVKSSFMKVFHGTRPQMYGWSIKFVYL